MAQHNRTGKFGEAIAINYLAGKGYKILDVNWHYKHKELDIVAEYNNLLIIVEIKTRAKSLGQTPDDVMSTSKINNIINAAEAYIITKNIDLEVRFDLIFIQIDNGKWEIQHIENAFTP